jgi:hypothetical protein
MKRLLQHQQLSLRESVANIDGGMHWLKYFKQ